MADNFCISICFIDGAFHGRADQGEPEWPPSPLRLYQAIVAAAAAHWNEHRGPRHAESALRWLETLPPPVIASPEARVAQGYRLYVPDNAGDLVGRSWSKGGNENIANFRTEKSVRPTVFPPESEVHYLWNLADLPPGYEQHRDILIETIQAITHIGWGVDLVVARPREVTAETSHNLPGRRWLPTCQHGGIDLRTPVQGTLDNLNRRHTAFLNRVSREGFAPVPPLSIFDITSYRAANEPSLIPHAIFALRKNDDSGFRSFETTRRSLHVAGMMRHSVSNPALLRSIGWTEEMARRIVLGHGEAYGGEHKAASGPRLAFLPLPSIEFRGVGKSPMVGSVRRVLVAQFGELSDGDFPRLTRRLQNSELIEEDSKRVAAVLQRQTDRDAAIRPYLEKASAWATVTPVILPGYDDPRKLRQRLRENAKPLTPLEKAELLGKLDQRIASLLRKALKHSGFSEELIKHAELEWRLSGFWPGTALATQYAVGDQHRRYRRLHVKISWRNTDGHPLKVPGPICIGGGKFTGMGLFAALPDKLSQESDSHAS